MRREHEQILDTLDTVIYRLERMAKECRGGKQGQNNNTCHHHTSLGPPLPLSSSASPPLLPPQTLPLASLPSGSEGEERLGLDSLVERVEVAVKGLVRETHRRGLRDENSPPRREDEEQATLPLEMSMATIKYLTKYDLLSPNRLQHQHNYHRAKTQRLSRPVQQEPPPFTKILDEQVIKRMPKL